MSSSNVSSVTSHFSTAAEGFTTTLSSTASSGAATLALTSVSGLTNGNVFVGIIEPGTVGKEQTFTGTVDTAGTQITGVKWTRGSNTGHNAGVTIVDYVSGTGHNMMTKGLLEEHKQTGAHSDITADSLEVDGQTWANLLLGWQTVSDSWSYASGTGTNVGTITVPTDATTTYQAGMKLKFTQTTVKYAIITKVEATTLTIYMGTDYTIANAAISAISVSNAKAPFGFPIDPIKWTVSTTSSSDHNKASPSSGTWYGDTGLSATGPNISLPIGVWDVTYSANTLFTNSAATAATNGLAVSFSTSASSETDTSMTSYSRNYVATTAQQRSSHIRSKRIAIASTTTYYLIVQATDSGESSISLAGSTLPSISIKAVCAYL